MPGWRTGCLVSPQRTDPIRRFAQQKEVHAVRKSILALGLFGLVGCGAFSDEAENADSQVGMRGVEFMIQPIDGGQCHSTVLKGTKRMAGSAFVLPQVRLGRDGDSRPLFHVLKDDRGYLVSTGLYFPDGSGKDDSLVASDNRAKMPDCSFEEIRLAINKTASEADKVKIVSSLPAKRFVARLPLEGAETITFEFGSRETSIVEYTGKTRELTARIADENVFNTFIARLRSTGVQIDVDFHFSAQTTNSAKATVDLSTASAELDAMVTGSGMTPSGIMAEGEFKSRLAGALKKAKISIETDGDADFKTYADEIIKKLVVESPDLAVKDAETPDAIPPSAGGGAGGADGAGAAPPAASTEGVGATSEAAKGIIPKINAKAAVAALKKQSKFEIEISSSGEAKDYIFSTFATLRTSQLNANREPYLESQKGPSPDSKRVLQYAEDIKPGTAFFVTASSRRERKLSYAYRSIDYKTARDIKEADLADRFPLIAQYPDSIYDATAKFPRAAMYQSAFWWSVNTWGREELFIEESGEDYTKFASRSIETLDSIQLDFSNSAGAPINPKTNKPYGGIPISLLAKEGEARKAWEARYDAPNNRVLFVAKQHLGRLTIVNNESFPTTSKVRSGDADLYETRYFQATWGSFGDRKVDKTVFKSVGEKLSLPTAQSSVKLNIIPVKVKGALPANASKEELENATEELKDDPTTGFNVDIQGDFESTNGKVK
jgi:hypothetical protein